MSRSFRSDCLDPRVNGRAQTSVFTARRPGRRADEGAPALREQPLKAAQDEREALRYIAEAIRANPERADELVAIAISRHPDLAHRILVESIKRCPSAAGKILAAARLSRAIGARLVLGAVLLLVCQKLFGAEAEAQSADGAVPDAGPGGTPGQMAAFLAGLNAALALMPGRPAQSEPAAFAEAERLDDVEGHDDRIVHAAPAQVRALKTSGPGKPAADNLDFGTPVLGDGQAAARAHTGHPHREAEVEAVLETSTETDVQPPRTPLREAAPAARLPSEPPIDDVKGGMQVGDPVAPSAPSEPEAAPIQDWLMRQHARGDNLLRGGAEDDVFYGGSGSDLVLGAAGNDRLCGGGDDDLLIGDRGDDLVFGGKGGDDLYGGDGDDQIGGSSGDDKLNGGGGDDRLSGGSGADLLDGDSGDDLVNGGAGEDTIYGGAGSDVITGGRDDDTVFGSDGHDVAVGGFGDDLLDGEVGDDILSGGAGSDILSGGVGGDFLAGGAGNDILRGGDGEDWLSGGAGSDELEGGAGSDTYVISAAEDGVDVIADHEGENWLRIEGYPADAAVQGELQQGGDLLVLVVSPEDGAQAVAVIEDFESDPETLAGIEINGRHVDTETLILGTDAPASVVADERSALGDAVSGDAAAEADPFTLEGTSIEIVADEIGQNIVQLLGQAPENGVWAQITESGDLDILVRDGGGRDELAARLEDYLHDPGVLAGVEINGRSLSVEDLIAGLDLLGEAAGGMGSEIDPDLAPSQFDSEETGDIPSLLVDAAASALIDPRADELETEEAEGMGL